MMRTIALAALLALGASAAPAPALTGLWEASVQVNELKVPFKFGISAEGQRVEGWFFNGEDRVNSTSGQLTDGQLTLQWAHYGTKLTATVADGKLTGTYHTRRGGYTFQAQPAPPVTATPGKLPQIDGLWEIPVKSPKGEQAWHFVVQQKGPEVSATILRIDGDTGALTGRFADGKLLLSHFSGARPSVLEVTPQADGTLALKWNGQTNYTATRQAEARAKNLPAPSDPGAHTRAKNDAEPFRFSAPDLTGKLVTESDPKFRGKVVLVNISGSWCPNCHDEAPFLEAFYKKYRDQGLEIVALSFEEAEQLADPVRLRAFVAKYGLDYTVLLAGETSTAKEKLALQADNWNSWPTTFFLGRDGRVRHVHAGFAGKASGPLYEEAKKEFTATVERLLGEAYRSAR
jgi:thiol-disulfide isomerase/thioredoxin